jgi:hypothetical protein
LCLIAYLTDVIKQLDGRGAVLGSLASADEAVGEIYKATET